MTKNGALEIEGRRGGYRDFHMGAQASLPAFVSLRAILVLRRNPRKAQAWQGDVKHNARSQACSFRLHSRSQRKQAGMPALLPYASPTVKLILDSYALRA